MNKTQQKQQKRTRRQARIRARIAGTAERPRLSVFKSNKALYLQLINDDAGTTLAAYTTRDAKAKTSAEKAVEAGTAIAKAAMDKGITKVVFDRGGYQYLGQIKAVADAARKGGLIF